MDTQKKAEWSLVKEQGPNKLYLSAGGAVKITRFNEGTQKETLVIMCPARQYEALAMVTDFINDTANHVKVSVDSFKTNRERDKIKLQAQVLAAKLVESLKATGLSPEQISEIVQKQSA